MSEIPRDVMEAALSICSQTEPSDPGFELHVAIAQAILTERERCAQIAETLPLNDHWVVTKPEHWTDMTTDDGEVIGRMKIGTVRKLDSRAAIASAILNPT